MTLEEQVKALQDEVAALKKRLRSEDEMFLYFRQSYLAMVNILELFLGMRPTTSEIRKAHKAETKNP